MTTVNCSGNEELDFRLIFGEDVQQQLGPTGEFFNYYIFFYNVSVYHKALIECYKVIHLVQMFCLFRLG